MRIFTILLLSNFVIFFDSFAENLLENRGFETEKLESFEDKTNSNRKKTVEERLNHFNASTKTQYNNVLKTDESGSNLRLNIENNARQRQPFETQDSSGIISRKASLELGFRSKDDFSLYVKSNIADINYNLNRKNNQLNIEANKNIENLNVGLTYSF